MSPRDTLLALAIVIVWGVNFVAAKLGVLEVPPLALTALRYVAAVLPAIFFVPRPKVGLWLLIGYGMFVGAGQFGLMFTAIKMGMPAGLTSLVVQIQAFFSIGLAVLVLGERPSMLQLTGALIAFLGIGVIALERLEGAALLPLGMTLLGAMCWAIANTLTKKAGRINMLSFVIWSSLVPILPLLALSAVLEGPDALPVALSHISLLGVAAVLFTGWAGTVFGYGGWSVLLSRYPASLVAPYALLVPISGLTAAAIVLGETITTLEVIGSGLVFTGLLFNVFAPRIFAPRPVA